ncbi:hypothetical protein F2Q69_00001727 [Brassica cretica]|uniref:Uncharacterized protein n=1 Tax=Brassica cretica TaxID=69181 RepID=A0A8S9P123_BRACR|nr:hypothetical protein F2Q69_00001727 [Brassica cretica]
MRNDEDGTMDETHTQSHDLRNIEEPFDNVKNVEGSVVVRDERGEIESAETMVETEKKDFEEGYETEYEYEEKKKSGKKDKMDEDEDTFGRYEFEIEESVAEFEDEEPTERNQIPEKTKNMTEKERETETTKKNAKEREDNVGERGTMRNDEDGTMDETQTQSHYLRSIEEPFDSVKNVEGSVVVRDERGEIESDETMVETEKKDF